MKYGTRSNGLYHSGIRFESNRKHVVRSRRSESRFPHWRGVFMIALLCTLAACGDGDSGTAANVEAAAIGGLIIAMAAVASSSATYTTTATVFVRCM